MVRILGIQDLIVTALLIAMAFGVNVPFDMVVLIAASLFFKAFAFITDIGSMFDIGAAALLIISYFITPPLLVVCIFIALIGSKGLLSLLARG